MSKRNLPSGFREVRGLREVKVKRYGHHGLIPVRDGDCPFRGENSCISSSGMSLCGGLHEDDYDVEPGERGDATIRCMEDQTFDAETGRAYGIAGY